MKPRLFKPEWFTFDTPICKHPRKGKHIVGSSDGTHNLHGLFCEKCKVIWILGTNETPAKIAVETVPGHESLGGDPERRSCW